MQETVSLVANGQEVVKVPGGAKYFAVLNATAAFKVELDQRGKETAQQGTKFSDGTFKRITFFETNGTANSITFYHGDRAYDGQLVETFSQPTIDGQVVSVTNATRTEFLLTSTSTGHTGVSALVGPRVGLKRLKIRFQNQDAAIPVNIQIWDPGSATWRTFETLAAGEKSIVYETQDPIAIQNGGGAPVNIGALYICESL